MKKKYVFFDLDGTLTDSRDGILNSIEYMLKHFDITVSDRNGLRLWLGPPLMESLEKYQGFSKEKAWEGVLKYREYYDKKGIFENRVYEGVVELMETLRARGYSLMLATSKPEIAARRVMDHFDLTKYFDYVGGASQDTSRVKKGDVIRYVMETNHITDPDEVIMVGDRENDVAGAHQNDIRAVGVLYGYGTREELDAAGADYIAKTAGDVAEIIGNM